MKKPEKGIPVSVEIDSAKYWNATGIILEEGVVYDLEVPGKQTWIDGYGGKWPQVCSADGFSNILNVVFFMRRSWKHKWFSLMGAINEDEKTIFKIGIKYPSEGYKASKTGELTCFANDANGHYGNNRGVIQLTITRKS